MREQTLHQLFDLSGKGAIVTGAAMGIGEAIALRLAEAGAGVMIADINEEAAGHVTERIKAAGGEACAIGADTRSMQDAKKIVRTAVKAFGSLDILVNNAAIYPLVRVMEVNERLWDKVININLKGVFFYCQAAAEQMIKVGRGGKIINLASIDGLRPNPSAVHYSVSKSGVIMLTKALALELAPHHILVNAVAPGGIRTPGSSAAWAALWGPGSATEKAMERWVTQRVPLGRMGQPDDIAKVVIFLASGASDYMTGSLLLVDGGYLLS